MCRGRRIHDTTTDSRHIFSRRCCTRTKLQNRFNSIIAKQNRHALTPNSGSSSSSSSSSSATSVDQSLPRTTTRDSARRGVHTRILANQNDFPGREASTQGQSEGNERERESEREGRTRRYCCFPHIPPELPH
ncbi:unnamed protein product, partial [Ectocarpus fasciculatus]